MMNTQNSNSITGHSQTLMKKTLGLCLGASTVTIVQLESGLVDSTLLSSEPVVTDRMKYERPRIIAYSVHPHNGNPKENLIRALEKIDLKSFDRIAATGRKFRKLLSLTSIPEPEAVEYAFRYVKPEGMHCPAVVSAGGETFMAYVLNNANQISNVLTGNKCASGTGEFFLQQLRRMDVSLEEAAQWASTTESYPVSGRCSVFCKSDCTHATNKGIPRAKVTAGLCHMMANKILELLKKIEMQNIMIVGGTSQNHMMIEYLRQEIPGLIVPEEAPYFEALGAALWALENETLAVKGIEYLFNTDAHTFDTHPPLDRFADKVTFKSIPQARIKKGDICILGLDVGSTTTKAVLVRKVDNAMLAKIYLRTNGDPVGASRQCYQSILDQIKTHVDLSEISIIGVGVCGSGRQIAGLHALTEGVINEIIAHATAAIYFDAKVDTIFEIGGQDAKYTYITNGVASDYAMNEACSAGTGSFLEESALETLGVQMTDIAAIALTGDRPPNFNDQCAAFIASDIKNAIHEGAEHRNIIAGLVYSICMNYTNRVKGNRPVGEKIFMQGGVCYNQAVPIAMAALTGKPIIVPPEPGLMGAFGVALEIKNRIENGLLHKKSFSLEKLVNREVKYGKTFICNGGKEDCDRRCEIAMIKLDDQKYPFGGACNRYYNLRQNIKHNIKQLDLVKIRQKLVFEKYGVRKPNKKASYLGKVGLNRSFLTHTFYPLYSTFFTELGFEIVYPEASSREGIDQRGAAFCYPAELAHGFFHALLQREDRPDFIFLPHFKAIPTQDGNMSAQVCPFVQGETFYLQTTFRKQITELAQKGVKILDPILDMTEGMQAAMIPMMHTAVKMGARRADARAAFKKALKQQIDCVAEMKAIGRKALKNLEDNPDQAAVVIFARPYNGFADEAHMGIPHKLATRGIQAIPFDFLPLEHEKPQNHMYWGMGQLLLKAARLVKKHPQLFGTYITNFSCGPDSFIISYFRKIMGRKPSLTLELDSHTADAGLETRIEAFLDIVKAYRQLLESKKIKSKPNVFKAARTILNNGSTRVITSSGEALPMNDPRVTFLLPSMGETASEALAASFRAIGFNAIAHPPSDEEILKLGRANTTCKECLPLQLTAGTMLNYIQNKQRPGEVLVYFMATASGPCRFGQYSVYLQDLLERLQIPDVALFSLTSENSYGGLNGGFQKKAWMSILIADIMEDIRSMILANAVDVESALEIFKVEWNQIVKVLEQDNYNIIERQLKQAAKNFSKIDKLRPSKEVPVISLAGEIFVRRDGLSRQYLTEKLAEKGFATTCSPIDEWIQYSDYLVENRLTEDIMPSIDRFLFKLRNRLKGRYERRIKSILSSSGLVFSKPLNLKAIINRAKPFISPKLTGEAILTIGGGLTEVASHTCGMIAIGPFGCMPNRMSESILNKAMTRDEKVASEPYNQNLKKILENIEDLPFLAIESDGSPFPQLIEAKLETFCLRAQRLHDEMLKVNNGH